jgi:hypothetical protein
MTAEQLFAIVNVVAVIGWLILIINGRRGQSAAMVVAGMVPLFFAFLYAGLIIRYWGQAEGGFASLADVSTLFANPWLLLAGWMHFLAFDLLVGCWEVRNASQHRIPHWAIIPALILTFLFGPIGLLLYLLIRAIKTRRLFASIAE